MVFAVRWGSACSGVLPVSTDQVKSIEDGNNSRDVSTKLVWELKSSSSTLLW